MAFFTTDNEHFLTLSKDFKTLVDSRNFSQGQASVFHSSVLEFLSWLDHNGITRIQEVEPLHIGEYVQYLETRANLRRAGTLSDSSIGGHLLSVKTFFEFLLDTGELESIVLMPRKSRTGYESRQIATEQEIKLLYNACESGRDKVILSCAYGAGLRRSEIENLDVADINLSRSLLVREGKGRKNRTVILCAQVIEDFKAYLQQERYEYLSKAKLPTHAFIINDRGKRMSGDHMNSRLKELVAKTGNEDLKAKAITLHSLRASISVHLIDRGADMEFVQRFLGHSDIDTSHLYMLRRKQKLLLMAESAKPKKD